jgi:two-component system cell cycle response regulator
VPVLCDLDGFKRYNRHLRPPGRGHAARAPRRQPFELPVGPRPRLPDGRRRLFNDLEGVAELAESTARRLGLGEEEAEQISHAAELHDIGKVAIPDAILAKPGTLDPRDWEFIRRHTLIGERIIAAAPALGVVAKLVRSSHERWDGTGYPDRLPGQDIPLGARVVGVADAFNAMTSERPYSPAVAKDLAIMELRRHAGTQFDPVVVEAFCASSAELSAARVAVAAE